MLTDPLTVGLVGLAGLGVLFVFTSGARAGRGAERAVREITRVGGTAARMAITAAVVVGVQWAALSATRDPVVWAVVLGLPALFAGVTVARLLAVTEVHRFTGRVGGSGRGRGRRGGGRR